MAQQPVAGIAEDHDLAPGGLGAEPRRELVDQDTIVLLQGVLHGARGNQERLEQERLDQKGQHQRDAAEQRQLDPEGARALRAATGGRGGLIGRTVLRALPIGSRIDHHVAHVHSRLPRIHVA
jgi:hypothetical protein